MKHNLLNIPLDVPTQGSTDPVQNAIDRMVLNQYTFKDGHQTKPVLADVSELTREERWEAVKTFMTELDDWDKRHHENNESRYAQAVNQIAAQFWLDLKSRYARELDQDQHLIICDEVSYLLKNEGNIPDVLTRQHDRREILSKVSLYYRTISNLILSYSTRQTKMLTLAETWKTDTQSPDEVRNIRQKCAEELLNVIFESNS